MPMSDLTALAAARSAREPLGCEMVVPLIATRPFDGVSSSARHRSRVVLPEPDGPMMHTTSPALMPSETACKTVSAPKSFDSASAAIRGAVLPVSSCVSAVIDQVSIKLSRLFISINKILDYFI